MEHDRIAEKLKKIKALADRGVGGEKETAMRMYEELKARYEIKDEEIMLDTVSLHWFGYNGELEEDLLTQIFYKVTGSASYHVYTGKYKRRKKRGCDCTEIEAPADCRNCHPHPRNAVAIVQRLKQQKSNYCSAFTKRN